MIACLGSAISAALLVLFACNSTAKANNIAFVVGNGAYGNAKLDNAVNDARLMKSSLEKIGFEVDILINSNKENTGKNFKKWVKKIKKTDIVLFYYAGHGVQYRGENFLVPVDAEIKKEEDIMFDCISTSSLLNSLEDKNPKSIIIILDACRNNPFVVQRGGGRGLAAISAPPNTVIAYSTAPGQTAEDGTGVNSTFTKNLAANITIKGLTFHQVLTRTRRAVVGGTAGRQVPWDASSVLEDIYLNGHLAYANTVEIQPDVNNGQKDEFSLARVSRLVLQQLNMEFVNIPSGCFQMGSSEFEDLRSVDEGPQHKECVSSFWFGATEVSQLQWQRISVTNPSLVQNPTFPVENVSWSDVRDFINKANSLLSKGKVRLPTEIEWEYAARAQTDTPFCYGNTITSAQANYDSSFSYLGSAESKPLGRPTPVASYSPNAFGLYNMHGNVYEWCSDLYNANSYSAKYSQEVGLSGDLRVARGGSWDSSPSKCRSAARSKFPSAYRSRDLGFRLVYEQK